MSELEKAIELVFERLKKAKSHSLIEHLTRALTELRKAKNDAEEGHQ